MKWYDWPSYFLTAFSSLLCVSRLLQVRIHSTPGVDGAQPFRLAATGFLFSALPLACYSLPEDRRIYTAFIQTNSVCCLLPTRWESIWLGLAGCVFIGPAPRPFKERRIDPWVPVEVWSAVSRIPPFYLCLSYVEHFMWALMMVLMVVSPSTNIEGSYICRALLCSCSFLKPGLFFFVTVFLSLSLPPLLFHLVLGFSFVFILVFLGRWFCLSLSFCWRQPEAPTKKKNK